MAKQIIKKEEMVAIRNAITNEMETAKVTMIIAKDIPKYKEAFTLFFQEMNKLAIKRMKPVSGKLLYYLHCIVEYENKISKTTEEMAEEIGYSKKQVERGMKELEQLNIIQKVKHPQDKRSYLMFLNPYTSWKGKKKGRDKRIQDNPLQLSFFEKPKELIKPNADFHKPKKK
jgi:DNA-binding MarR family transcriptional regulator